MDAAAASDLDIDMDMDFSSYDKFRVLITDLYSSSASKIVFRCKNASNQLNYLNMNNKALLVGINAYPNPASSQIEFDLAKEDIYVVKLYNSLGQEINCELNANGQISVLNVDDLDSGFYIISFQLNDQSSYTSKFQVIH